MPSVLHPSNVRFLLALSACTLSVPRNDAIAAEASEKAPTGSLEVTLRGPTTEVRVEKSVPSSDGTSPLVTLKGPPDFRSNNFPQARLYAEKFFIKPPKPSQALSGADLQRQKKYSDFFDLYQAKVINAFPSLSEQKQNAAWLAAGAWQVANERNYKDDSNVLLDLTGDFIALALHEVGEGALPKSVQKFTDRGLIALDVLIAISGRDLMGNPVSSSERVAAALSSSLGTGFAVCEAWKAACKIDGGEVLVSSMILVGSRTGQILHESEELMNAIRGDRAAYPSISFPTAIVNSFVDQQFNLRIIHNSTPLYEYRIEIPGSARYFSVFSLSNYATKEAAMGQLAITLSADGKISPVRLADKVVEHQLAAGTTILSGVPKPIELGDGSYLQPLVQLLPLGIPGAIWSRTIEFKK